MQFTPHRLRLIVIAFAAVLVLGAILGIAFLPHMLWRFSPSFRSHAQEQPIRIVAIDPKLPTGDVVRCHFGSISFLVPRDMTNNRQFSGKGGTVSLQSKGAKNRILREILVRLPGDNSARADAVESELPRLGRGMTAFERELAVLRAHASDFRWDMSSEELQWHKWLVHDACLFRIVGESRVELVQNGNVEGFFKITSLGPALEWSSNRGRVFGFLLFNDRQVPSDLDWARPIAASVQFNGEVYPTVMTDQEIERLFRVE